MNNKLKSLLPIVNTFFVSAFPFFLFIIAIRLIEGVTYSMNRHTPEHFISYEFQGFLYDLLTSIVVSGFLIIPFILLSYLHQKTGKRVQLTIQALLILASIFLSLYFVVATEPLDHVIFTYSLKDIMFAGKSSAGSSSFQIIIILLVIILYLFVIRKARKRTINTGLLIFFSCISLCGICFPAQAYYENDNDQLKSFFVNNKLSYFVAHCYNYLTTNENANATSQFVYLNQNSCNWQFIDPAYPLLHKENTPDVLGPYFNVDNAKKPNIVFIIVESLSRSVVGDDAKLGNFTPFLDSLSKKSLYWPNFLSTAERTFNVLPSSLGSLPYSKKGFMDIPDSTNFPDHYTSLRLLHEKGYYTRFYVGCWLHFGDMDGFMSNEKIDYLVSDWNDKYVKISPDKAGFTWGFSDEAIYKKSLDDVKEHNIHEPRFDVLLTVTSHTPFITPNQPHFEELVKQQFQKMKLSEEQTEEYMKDLPEYSALMYSDDAIRNYFNEYKKRDDFKNTIFFIFGDHAMPELDLEKTVLERYNIPLIVYSPMLKKSQRFEAVSTHLNITPTLLAFLRENYSMVFPQKVAWMAGALDTSKTYRNVQVVPFMRSNKDMVDLLNRDYFISGNQLYKVNPGLKITPITDDKKLNELKSQLQSFISLNKYICGSNKIAPCGYLNPDQLNLTDFYTGTVKDESKVDSTVEYFTVIEPISIDHKKHFYLEMEFDYFTTDISKDRQPCLVLNIGDKKNKNRVWDCLEITPSDKSPLLPGKWMHIICKKTMDVSKISELPNININSYFWNNKKCGVKYKNIQVTLKANI